MADTISAERRSWNMSRIRSRDTKPELLLRSALHKAGFRFRLHSVKLPGRPDIVLPKYRTAVFVHGCFWHRHSGCRNATTSGTRTDFWIAKFQGTVKRDREVADKLISQGWRVIVVWECELEGNLGSVTQKICHQLTGVN